MKNDDYEEGRRDARNYYDSQAYSSLSRYIKADDAMRIFKSPVKESMTQVSTPLPKDRQNWIKGFTDEQAVIKIERPDLFE